MHKSLETLKKNNPEIELKEFSKTYAVLNAWNDSSFALVISKKKRIPSFSNIILMEEFSSILDTKNNIWEFIYTPEKKDKEIIKRKFDFIYEGKKYDCSFEKSSRYLKFFAESFRLLKSETKTSYRNLRQFKDYYSKDKADYVKEYFKDRLPYSFYVKGDINDIEDKIKFAKTLNFYLSYYDRQTPLIQVFNTDKIDFKTKVPCYTLFDVFPTEINASSIDLTLLDILSVASKTTDIRLEFIFYYQILEYAAYYHIESEDDQKLRQILKRPDINLNANDYIKEIMEVLSERFNIHKTSDKTRIDKTIKRFCSIKDIELELKENEESLNKKIVFDGGLKISGLFKDISAVESGANGILNDILNNISKIRNVIVHLRESRENTVILPTERNNELLLPYLYLLRRIAEKVAIQFE
ncbi:hypothetical protein [Polaribacter septentrionalilitoris]|uniref:hypothetical protein n=1 Tax=Polaribacter septentrionalilitoris TaxID=2494657 RepID=UPI00135A02C4|nr:hypothetical protein [Polaribacter septentrionalilitoris]